MSRIRWYGPLVVLLGTVALVMVTGPTLVKQIAWARDQAQIEKDRAGLEADPSLVKLNDTFRKVARAVEPSVVYIQVYAKQSSVLRRSLPFDSPFDRDETDNTPSDRGDMDRYNAPRDSGAGSGWVYRHHDAAKNKDEDYIITNNHVVTQSNKIVVRFYNGEERTGKVVGMDLKTDIAVVKVEGGQLTPAALSEEPVEQGDIVFAFGSPFRFDFSMSQGIVSAKGRTLGILQETQGYEDFIQTDAAINPGNSGGPLTNIRGQVVGMNTAIASRTGTYNGLGFAIPIAMVKNVAEQLINNGKVSRGYLGVYIRDLDPKMAKTFGFSGKGALVESLLKNGPAEKIGLQRGDIVSKINDKATVTADDLRNYIAGLAVGTKVTLEVFRDGKTITLSGTVGEMPDENSRVEATPGGGGESTSESTGDSSKGNELIRKLGLETVDDFTADMAAQMRRKFAPGVIVLRVRQDSQAEAQGLTRGSVITEVQRVKVKSIKELAAELAKHDLTKGVNLSVRDTDRDVDRFVYIELPEK